MDTITLSLDQAAAVDAFAATLAHPADMTVDEQRENIEAVYAVAEEFRWTALAALAEGAWAVLATRYGTCEEVGCTEATVWDRCADHTGEDTDVDPVSLR